MTMQMFVDRNSGMLESSKPAETDEIVVHEFTEKSATAFRQQVRERASDPNTPITIYIDSYGGYVDALASMLDTMDEMPNPFITIALGKSMSCGAILLSHGDYRYCGKYARVMVHEVSAGSWGNVKTLKNDTQEILRLNHKMMDLLAKNCGLTGYAQLKEKFKEHDADEIWMSAEDALAFNIVDHIGLPKLVPTTVFQCVIPPEKERIKHTRAERAAKTKKTKTKKTKKK